MNIIKMPELPYREAGENLYNQLNFNSLQIESYADFVMNVLPEILSKPIAVDNRITIDLSNYRIDTSSLVSQETAKASKTTREWLLRSNAIITLKTGVNKTQIEVDIGVLKIPQLDKKGVFTLSGVDRVLISHLELANQFTKGYLTNKKGVKSLSWSNMFGCKMVVALQNNQHTITTLYGRLPDALRYKSSVSGKSTLQKMSIQKILTQLGYRTKEDQIIGPNPNMIFNMNDFDSGNTDLLGIKSVPISQSERRQINDVLSYRKKALNFKLSKDITDKGEVLFKKGTKLSVADLEEITKRRIDKIYIDTPYGEYPVISNRMVNIQTLIDEGFLSKEQIPKRFLDKKYNTFTNTFDIEKLNEVDSEITYKDINYSEFNKILSEIENNPTLDIENLLEVRADLLLGTKFTDDDLLAIINLYSLYTANIYKPDDIDSLSNKRILTVSDIFTRMVYEKLYGKYIKLNGAKSRPSQDSLAEKYQRIVSSINFSSANKDNSPEDIIDKLSSQPHSEVPSLAAMMVKDDMDKLFQIQANLSPQEEIAMKRKVSQQEVEGYGGISSESSDASPRGVKPSHMGRLCCIETPEGGAVGLVLYLASMTRVTRDGYLEAPYFRVDKDKMKIDTTEVYYMLPYEEERYTRSLGAKIADKDSAKIVYLNNGLLISEETVTPIYRNIQGKIKITNLEDIKRIAERTLKVLKTEGKATDYQIEILRKDWFEDSLVNAIEGVGELIKCTPEEIDFIACTPYTLTSLTAGTIPFNAYSEGTRQLMGCQMLKQAEPVLGSRKNRITTTVGGVAKYTNTLLIAPFDCIVESSDSQEIKIRSIDTDELREYNISNATITSETVLISYKPKVQTGDFVPKGGVLADSTSTEDGEVKFGRDLLVGYMPYYGYNFEDSIVINKRLVREDTFTSYRSVTAVLTIDDDRGDKEIDLSIENLDIKDEVMSLGFTTTPYVSQGKKVRKGDVLALKLIEEQAKGSQQPVYKLSRLEYQEESPGTVVAVTTKREGPKLHYNILISTEEKITLGDKMSGRHGNKGVVGRIVDDNEMPYMEDGRRFDMLLTPLGVPTRMNLGQIIELELGGIAEDLDLRLETRTGELIDMPRIKALVKEYYGPSGKMKVYDGISGEEIDGMIAVGVSAMAKLKHLSGVKLRARSTGGYTLYEQPLSGKKNKGGQKIGEMEVDSLLAHGAEYVTKEIFAKSDSPTNREILKKARKENRLHETTITAETPRSYSQLISLMRALGTVVEHYDEYDNLIDLSKDRQEAYGVVKENVNFSRTKSIDNNECLREFHNNLSMWKKIEQEENNKKVDVSAIAAVLEMSDTFQQIDSIVGANVGAGFDDFGLDFDPDDLDLSDAQNKLAEEYKTIEEQDLFKSPDAKSEINLNPDLQLDNIDLIMPDPDQDEDDDIIKAEEGVLSKEDIDTETDILAKASKLFDSEDNQIEDETMETINKVFDGDMEIEDDEDDLEDEEDN